MIGLVRALLLTLALALGYALPAAAATAPPQVDPGRQVLVLLRMPPKHFRPNADYSDSYGDGQGQRARNRVAERLARRFDLVRVENWAMPMLGVDCFVMTVAEGQSPAEVAEKLSHEPAVAWSEPMNLFYVQSSVALAHNDPLFRVQPTASEWRLADLHQISTGRNVRVAVIDSRVDRLHPDLAGQIEFSEDFALAHPDGAEHHGTGVAGIIAAVADNDMGITGVAPHSKLMALRACWQQGAEAATVCDTLSLAKALDFAISHNAQVINLSLAGPHAPLLGKLLDVAMARGATVVSAFDPRMPRGGFPASHLGIIAVAEEASGGTPAGIYNAPGRDVPTTQPGGRWYLVNGSSYAAAHVSGLVALLRERGPGVRKSPLSLVASQAGRIDACASLLRNTPPCTCACSQAAN